MNEINNPEHYTQGKIEVWDFIVSQGMDFLRGNIVKYAARAPYKGTYVKDMDKIIAYASKAKEVYLNNK
jgi:hypothetical protein